MKKYTYGLSFDLRVNDSETQHVQFHIITNEALSFPVHVLPYADEGQLITYENPRFVLILEWEKERQS